MVNQNVEVQSVNSVPEVAIKDYQKFAEASEFKDPVLKITLGIMKIIMSGQYKDFDKIVNTGFDMRTDWLTTKKELDSLRFEAVTIGIDERLYGKYLDEVEKNEMKKVVDYCCQTFSYSYLFEQVDLLDKELGSKLLLLSDDEEKLFNKKLARNQDLDDLSQAVDMGDDNFDAMGLLVNEYYGVDSGYGDYFYLLAKFTYLKYDLEILEDL